MIQDTPSTSAREAPSYSHPALIDINALAQMLNISKGTLYNWVYLKRIPFIKAGRCLRFDPAAVFNSLRHCPTMAEAGKR